MRVAELSPLLAAAMLFACASAYAAGPTQMSTAHHDTEFLKTANQGSVDEVDLAQFVLKKTSDPDVKAFAQKMIDDHTKLLDDMKPFDQEAGVTVPDHADLATRAVEAKLELLAGKSFDKAYIKDMVEDHAKDLQEFRKEASSTGYPAFKAAVAKGASVIKEHLEMVDQLAKKNGIPPASVPGA